MDMQCPNSPSAPFFVAPSSSMNTGFTWPSGLNYSPLDIDIWFTYFVDTLFTPASLWTNPVGTLSSTGANYNTYMLLPPWPTLVGYDLHHVGVTGEVGLPDDLKEVTEVHTYTFWPLPTALTVSDDGSELVNLPFTFNFFGNAYTSVYVNMNGNLTFGAGSSDFSESSAEFLADAPRIAGCWDDIEANQPGSQSGNTVRTRVISQGLRQLVVEWINVGEYVGAVGSTGANTFRIIIKDDNTITLEYRDMTLADCIIGISPGGGLSSASEVDLSSRGGFLSSGAIFEQFAGGGDDLDFDGGIYFDRVTFTPTSAAATTYRLGIDLR
jgi:hypothetical protein